MQGRTLTSLACAVLLAGTMAASPAELAGNPYAGISARNSFGLRPIPVETNAPLPPAPAPAPGVDVFLTGIWTVGGLKLVLLHLEDKTPGSKTEYLPPLFEKEAQGRVEVVSIEGEPGAVVVKIDGTEQTLTFEKDGPRAEGATRAVPTRSTGPVQRTLRRFSASYFSR